MKEDVGLIISVISFIASVCSLIASYRLSRKTDDLIRELKRSVKNMSLTIVCKEGQSFRFDGDDIIGRNITINAETPAINL